MPEIALIPPYSYLPTIRRRKLQMLLPICLRSSPHSYEEQRWYPDTYSILDNGMFEGGNPVPTEELLSLAQHFNVKEVVMPDLRDDGPETFRRVKLFLKDYEQDNLGTTNITFMAVVQGANPEERRNTIDAFADILPEHTVLGFPRRLTQEHHTARLDLMEYTVCTYGTRFKLHMLGMSREWPAEFLRAARQLGSHLRSLDTSAPYAYAYHSGTISSQWDAKGERPNHFFSRPVQQFPDKLVKYNISVLEAWAQGLMHMPYYDERKV